jgi:hypothetical protein
MGLTISLVYQEEIGELLSSDWDAKELLDSISKYYITTIDNEVLSVTDEDENYLYCYVIHSSSNSNGDLTLSKNNVGRMMMRKEIDFTNDLEIALNSVYEEVVI